MKASKKNALVEYLVDGAMSGITSIHIPM